MALACTEPFEKTDQDLQTFECSTCAYAETLAVELR
jgi:hypothetical protein